MLIRHREIIGTQALALLRRGVPALMARLLCARGQTAPTDLGASAIEEVLPYTEMMGCEQAAQRLLRAHIEREPVLVVADYDADGATACAVMMRALRAYGLDVDFLIPHRLEHGYGLTPEIVDVIAALPKRPSLVVTVDNGISSHAGIDKAREYGIEVLVTDHHLPAQTLPSASVIVDPSQPGCTFPSKALAGCGVAWYVMWALQDLLFESGIPQADPTFSVESLLPIVAVGTVADVVPLDFNNRLLVGHGLRMIRQGQGLPGIGALATTAGKAVARLSTSDIAFAIGPQINAAGRLESMDTGVRCLLSDEPGDAQALAGRLHDINLRRKDIELSTVEEALRQVHIDFTPDQRSMVLYSTAWHPGVIGIVAGRLKERFFRPVFVLADGGGGTLKGSGRAIPALHLRDALDNLDKIMPGVLLKFGGHAAAAGLTINADRLADFQRGFEEVCSKMLRPEDLRQELVTDGPLDLVEMSQATVSMLREQVWGQAFPEPIFSDVFDVVSARPIGEGQHMKMLLSKAGRKFSAVQFRYGGPPPEGLVQVAYKLDVSTYKDTSELQLIVEHCSPAPAGSARSKGKAVAFL